MPDLVYTYKCTSRFDIVERNEIVRLSQEALWTDEAALARDYLINQRRLSEGIIRQFELGYIPDDVNHQLHGRIIMPLRDASGNLIAITSRVPRKPLDNDPLPVYWHEKYEKSFYLYGLNIAKKSMRKSGFAILVEGQFDVLQMHCAGAINTLGLCSTNLHKVQLSMISRYCEDIILCLDNDDNKSGQKGVSKIIKNFFNKETNRIGVVTLDGAKDPDEYIKKYGFNPLKSLIHKELNRIRENYAY